MVRVVKVVRVVNVVKVVAKSCSWKRVQFLYSFYTHPPSGQYDIEHVYQELAVYISEL